MEPELANYGWRCPHRRPTVMGSIGNLVVWCAALQAVEYKEPQRLVHAGYKSCHIVTYVRGKAGCSRLLQCGFVQGSLLREE
jgi:hypothetical protein